MALPGERYTTSSLSWKENKGGAAAKLLLFFVKKRFPSKSGILPYLCTVKMKD